MKTFRLMVVAITMLLIRYLMSAGGVDIPWWLIFLLFITIGVYSDDD